MICQQNNRFQEQISRTDFENEKLALELFLKGFSHNSWAAENIFICVTAKTHISTFWAPSFLIKPPAELKHETRKKLTRKSAQKILIFLLTTI